MPGTIRKVSRKALNELYDAYRLYVNFFLPSAKLVSKVRVGAKVRKIYDTPQTPYQRLMASGRCHGGGNPP